MIDDYIWSCGDSVRWDLLELSGTWDVVQYSLPMQRWGIEALVLAQNTWNNSEQIGRTFQTVESLWNLCAHALSKQWTWLLAPTWHTVPIRDKVYLKGSTPKWSTSEHCSPSTDALLQCLTGERESTSQPSSSDLINQTSRSSSSKGKKKTYTGVHLRTCSCQITFDLLSDRWRKKWSCGTSPAESFMTLPLPGCWSLTKVCPVELRSTMDTFKGSTSAKVPGVKWGCSMLFLKWGYPSWMVYLCLFHGKSYYIIINMIFNVWFGVTTILGHLWTPPFIDRKQYERNNMKPLISFDSPNFTKPCVGSTTTSAWTRETDLRRATPWQTTCCCCWSFLSVSTSERTPKDFNLLPSSHNKSRDLSASVRANS